MSLKTTIESEIKQAMLNKEKDRLRALRAIKSLILLAETEKGGGDGLSEDTEMKLLTKAAKQRRNSLSNFFHCSKKGELQLRGIDAGQAQLKHIE